MRPIVKFELTKDGIISTLHMVFRYGTYSVGGTRIFNLIVVQGVDKIAFVIKHLWKPTLSSPLFRANISTLQLE